VSDGTDGRSDDVVAPADDPRSRFYLGTILRLHSGSRSGVVRTGSGREIPFVIAGVRFLGDASFGVLREGMEIGFDVGWTSRGMRVTTIRLFD
jgi:hypothetical protein